MAVLDRAYALLDVQALDAARRTLTGIAVTPTPDRSGDVFDPRGATFAAEIPLLLHHDRERPVGSARLTATPDAIVFEATVATVDAPGPLRDRLEETWQSLVAGLIKGISIGFRPLKNGLKVLKNGGLHVLRSEICELSLVTIPKHMEATILTIQSLDAPHVTAAGAPVPRMVDTLPVVRAEKAAPAMTTTEQITAFENTRAAKAARMTSLMQKAAEAEVTLDAPDTEEYDQLELEVKSIDAHLVRLRALEKTMAAIATPVPATPGATAPIIQVKANVPPGTAFVRYAMALVNGRGDSMRAIECAKQWRESTPEVELMVKAAVAPGDATNPAWAGVLVQFKTATDEFLALLRPATILGKIRGLRQVPFMTQVPVQTGGGTYGWVGQGAPKPVGKLALTTAALQFSKAAGIIVITEELAKLSSPSAEQIVRGDMIAGMAQFLDLQFIDPAVAEVANVSPASITNGADTAASTNDPFGDLHAIASYFATNEIPLAGLTVIMSETNALAMGMFRDAGGNRLFPGMTAEGGSAEGLTVIASNAAATKVIGLQPSGILYADEGGVNIDVSREASVIMDSVPPTDGTGVLTSFWQNNLVGLRAERMINWLRARPKSVYYLTAAAYTPTAAT